MLSAHDIRLCLHRRDIVIKPLRPQAIQPASFDLTLGARLACPLGLLPPEARIDPKVDMALATEYIDMSSEGYLLAPGGFLLAHTTEWLELPTHLVAHVDGRSSVGRLGLFVENAGFIDPGFRGEITLEIYNASGRPFRLYSGMPIAQLSFDTVGIPGTEAATFEKPDYKGKYQGQTGPTPSRVHRNWDDDDRVWK